MSQWIKIGLRLYNLDMAQHIDLDAILTMASDMTTDGVRIVFEDGKAAEFLGPEADALRQYVAEQVAQQRITDLSIVPASPRPESLLDPETR